jgi:tryptophanyl-tRNA synthetase
VPLSAKYCGLCVTILPEERRVSGETGPKQKRVLSGMRPTGKLHIGHYFGALQNWVRLQNDPAYDCFYFIADWHALTSDYADTSAIAQNVIEIATDYLAAGLDPEKSVIFQQSQVPEHAELHLLLGMVTPLSWLERVPTYKEQIENITSKDLHTYGFLGYPCLQTADIVMYSEPGTPLFVPVGEDQVSHVELSREIVRRLNTFYGLQIDHVRWFKEDASNLIFDAIRSGGSVLLEGLRRQALEDGIYNWMEKIGPRGRNYVRFSDVLVEPDVMLTQTPRIPGTDGRKMSKSYGNAITLSESDADIYAKTKVMVTDPARKRRTDPGNPDICPVGDWHKLFSKDEPGRMEWVYKGCTTAAIGCIECKKAMADNLVKWIAPVRERRIEYEKHPKRVLEIIDAGSKNARKVAQGTMERVRDAVFHWKDKRKEIGS